MSRDGRESRTPKGMLCRKNQAALEKRERMAWYERMLVMNKRGSEGEREGRKKRDGRGVGEGRVDKGFGRLICSP